MPACNTKKTTGILIASRNTPLVERFTGILCELFDLCTTVNPTDADTQIKLSLPQIVILDPGLFGATLADTIKTTITVSPLSRIIILDDDNGQPVNQMDLFKCGAHGFCACTISPELLLKAIHAVSNGEIWVPRQLISQLIGELAHVSRSDRQSLSAAETKAVDHLTPRELQVAQMIRLGGNNKAIARELDISERTVKAHLSAIFRKLDVENRLHLALFFKDIT